MNLNLIELIVCFESAARAIMAERMLLEQAFNVRIMPLPAEIQAGCGFCLRFLPEDIEMAAAFLLEHALPITGAYMRESSNGSESYTRISLEKGVIDATGR